MVFFPFMFAIRGAMAPKEMRKLDIAPKMSLPKPCFFQCDISSTPWFSSLPQSAVRPRIVSSSVTFFMHHSMKVAPRDPNASCPWMRPRTLNCSTPQRLFLQHDMFHVISQCYPPNIFVSTWPSWFISMIALLKLSHAATFYWRIFFLRVFPSPSMFLAIFGPFHTISKWTPLAQVKLRNVQKTSVSDLLLAHMKWNHLLAQVSADLQCHKQKLVPVAVWHCVFLRPYFLMLVPLFVTRFI